MRPLALLATLVTALGAAGLGCAQAPPAEEAASETMALEDLQVLAPGARFTAVRELVLSGPSLGVMEAPDGQRLARWHAPGTVAQVPDLASTSPNRRTSHAP